MAPQQPPALTPEEARMQHILKIVVVGLAIAILVVLGLIVYKMVSGPKRVKPAVAEVAAEHVAAESLVAAGPANGFGQRAVAMPADGEIVETTLGTNVVVLRVRGHAGDELIVLDLLTGAERGRFVLKLGE